MGAVLYIFCCVLLIIIGPSIFQPILYYVDNGNLPALSSAFCPFFQTLFQTNFPNKHGIRRDE
ncbi:MAG: hypothetical protein D3914_10225 [Candidatus Electrothrix sp. LOE2]|nr:hypothetical protein [Candidatus Electrothrix sp. LOE2]